MRSERNGGPSKVDETLETVSADFFWVPDDVHVVERDAVTYTYSDRSAEVYNCVSRVRPENCDVGSLVTEVVDRHRGSSSKWYITPMSDDPELLDALKTAGYDADRHFHAYAVEAAEYDRDVPDDIEVRKVRSVSDLQMWYEISEDVTGDSPELSDEDLARAVDECTGWNRRVTRSVAYHREKPAGCARIRAPRPHDVLEPRFARVVHQSRSPVPQGDEGRGRCPPLENSINRRASGPVSFRVRPLAVV